jgi:DNA invertase Pin-like site-specific DNA recombinase
MDKYVAYYRVSTDRQGQSGLGLAAQRAAVSGYLAGRGDLLAEYTEIESGTKNDRPQLAMALGECRRRRARLVIAKLDRLARNVHFISGLLESGVDFVAVDMPEASRLTLHILAAVAEHEREMISRRTKEALAAAKARGRQLGNPTPAPSLQRGRVTVQAHRQMHRDQVRPLIKQLRGEGWSLRAIAAELNRRGIVTVLGKHWAAAQVRNVLLDADASST